MDGVMTTTAEHSGALAALVEVINDARAHRDAAREDAELLIKLAHRMDTCLTRGEVGRAAQYALHMSVVARNAASQLEISIASERAARRVVDRAVDVKSSFNGLDSVVAQSGHGAR
jgi:hypothetical protein